MGLNDLWLVDVEYGGGVFETTRGVVSRCLTRVTVTRNSFRITVARNSFRETIERSADKRYAICATLDSYYTE